MASLGPLESFVFPGPYTQTRVEAPSASTAGDVRYTALVGVGNETELVEGYELVRGSSSTAANVIVGENLATNGKGNTVDGVNVSFLTAVKPIVLNDGPGTFASKPSDVLVTVDGVQVPVQAVDGYNGIVTLVDAPQSGQLVEIAYYYKRRDTYVTSEDVSSQVDTGIVTFVVDSPRIVKGDNSGSLATASDIGKTVEILSGASRVNVPVISVTVNGVAATIVDIDGSARTFTLSVAPTAGATVVVNYFTSDFINSYDLLPTAAATSIVAAGYDPGVRTWFNGVDYVLTNGNRINWGNSIDISAGVTTAGTTQLINKISGEFTTDDRLFFNTVATDVAAGTKSFTLPFVPVRGDGSGKPMTDPQNGTPGSTADDLLVYAGATLAAALASSPIAVTKISGQVITLATAPALHDNVYATYYVSNLRDGGWVITNKTAGASGVGKYNVTIPGAATAYQVLATGLALPAGGYAFNKPSYNLVRNDETVTVTVSSTGKTLTITSTGLTAGTGACGQTYVDAVTGFTVYIPVAGTADDDVFTFTVKKDFVAATTTIEAGIPGIKYVLTDTTGVTVGDSLNVQVLNLSVDGEPKVGDNYYVSFNKVKTDYSVKYLTNFTDVTRQYGPLSQENKIVIGAWLAFLNGAPAVAIKQIKKNSGGIDANVADYIAGIDVFDEPLLLNGTRPSLVQAVTTDTTVIAYLKTSNSIQSSIRYRNERTSYFGFRSGTTMDTVINRCKGLSTEYLTAVYPDTAVVTIPDQYGTDQDITLSGEYIACAMAGADLSPSRDVATPLTNVSLVGFKRLGRQLRTVDAQQIASAGCTVLEFKGGVTKILMALTTDMSSPLTRDPRIIEIKHDIQKGARNVTDPFVGIKGLPNVPGSVQKAMNAFFVAKKAAQIVYDFKGVKAAYDAADPTVINVEAYYKPIFGVNWIIITFNISTTL